MKKYLKQKAELIDKALLGYVNKASNSPHILNDSISYSISAKGKRLRPILLLLTAELFGKNIRPMIPYACALEMIHTYSLIHDDLPSMDNDTLRRGKPTSHIVFGEDLALLSGDALLTLAFEIFTKPPIKTSGVKVNNILKALEILAKYAGAEGMVGGQVADIYAEGIIGKKSKRSRRILKNSEVFKNKKLEYFIFPKKQGNIDSKKILRYIYHNKTGALLTAPCEIASILCDAKKSDILKLKNYGMNIGLAFQIVDDILEHTSDEKNLGKSSSDIKNDKLTYVSLYGYDMSRKQAKHLIDTAKSSIQSVHVKTKKQIVAQKILTQLADYILERNY